MAKRGIGRALDAAVQRGYLELVAIALLAVPTLAIHVSASAFHLGALLVDAAILTTAALTGRWPRMAGIAVASLLLVYVAHPDWPTLGEYAPLIVVVCLGVRGRATLRRWLAPVYLLGLVAVSWLGLPAGVQPLPYAIVWCVFMAIAWGRARCGTP